MVLFTLLTCVIFCKLTKFSKNFYDFRLKILLFHFLYLILHIVNYKSK